MAENHSTVSSLNPARIAQVTEPLASCAGDIYALDDIGRRLVGSPFTPLTMSQVVSALAQSIRSNLEKCNQLLPGPIVQPAHLEVAEALDALETLEGFMRVMTDLSCNDKDFNVSTQTVGTTIHELTIRAARAIGRAELACGASVSATEYLERCHVEACHG